MRVAAAAAILLLHAEAAFVQDRFAITFFLDPQPTDESFRLVAGANFSVFLASQPADKSKTQRQAELCAKHGLRCILGGPKRPSYGHNSKLSCQGGVDTIIDDLPPKTDAVWGCERSPGRAGVQWGVCCQQH